MLGIREEQRLSTINLEIQQKQLTGKWSKVESETRQPGVIQNKINEHHTYLEATNYWTPLNIANDENEED
jgi:hypothetical protein